NEAVVDGYLALRGSAAPPPETSPAAPPETHPGSFPGRGLVLSCWTRKDTKNWPFPSWDALLEKLLARGESVTVIAPPDGDDAFAEFRARWEARAAFVMEGLPG